MTHNEFFIHYSLWSNDFLFSFGKNTPESNQVQKFLMQELKGVNF